MNPNILYPVDPKGEPIELTNAQLAELDRKWDETFTADFKLRVPPPSPERKSRLLALLASYPVKVRQTTCTDEDDHRAV